MRMWVSVDASWWRDSEERLMIQGFETYDVLKRVTPPISNLVIVSLWDRAYIFRFPFLLMVGLVSVVEKGCGELRKARPVVCNL